MCAIAREVFDRPALCRDLGLSEGYLSRCFQRSLGSSFVEHRARLRIVRFVTHVTRDRQSLLEAALNAGFGSYSQLHRVFLKIIGLAPRRYFSGENRNARALIAGPLATRALEPFEAKVTGCEDARERR